MVKRDNSPGRTVTMTFRLKPENKQDFDILCTLENVTMGHKLNEFIIEFLKKNRSKIAGIKK